MHIPDAQLKASLAEAGLVSRKVFEEAEAAAAEGRRRTADVLISRGVIGADDLRRAHAHLLGIPFSSVDHARIPYEVFTLIPEPVARAHGIIALARTGADVDVAVLDIDSLAAIDFLKPQLRILPHLTDESSLRSALLRYQRMLRERFGDTLSRASSAFSADAEAAGTATILPAVQLFDVLMRHALLSRASDAIIETREDSLVIRYRIDGVLHEALRLPVHAMRALSQRIRSLASIPQQEGGFHEGKFARTVDGERITVRAAIIPTIAGEKISLRIMRAAAAGFTLESLGFHGTSLDRVHEALLARSGLILVAGPEGAGKTTTLYTMLDLLASPESDIATIEDPIEYRLKYVSQSEVNAASGFTYPRALRGILRQHPHAVMIGEIRDHETALAAVHAASNGTLVLAGIEAKSATEALARMRGYDIDPVALASALSVIIGQRVVPAAADAEPRELSREEDATLRTLIEPAVVLRTLKEEDAVPKNATWRALRVVSETAEGKRCGIQEVLPVSAAVAAQIVRDASAEDITRAARAEGMISLAEDAACKALQGRIPVDAVKSVV